MKERIEHICSKFESGLDSPLIVAYHGLTLPTLKSIINLGYEIGSNRNTRFTRKGDVFVFPIEGRSNVKARLGNYSEEEARINAEIYASGSAQIHYIVDKLELNKYCFRGLLSDLEAVLGSIEEQKVVNVNQKWCSKEVLRGLSFLKSYGLNEKEINNLLEEARKKKGIVIGYSKEIYHNSVLCGDDGHDLRVIRPSYQCIEGIDSQDIDAYEFLEGLQEKV